MEAMTSGPHNFESLHAAPESIPQTVAAGSEGPPSPPVEWRELESAWGVPEVQQMTAEAQKAVAASLENRGDDAASTTEQANGPLGAVVSDRPFKPTGPNMVVAAPEEPAPQPGRRTGALRRMFSRKPQQTGSQLDWSAMKRFEETPPVIEADKPYANESHATLPNSKPGFVSRAVARLSRGAMPKGRRR